MDSIPTFALLLSLFTGATALTGNGRIHGTDQWLRFNPHLANGIAVGAQTGGIIVEAAASRAFLPTEIRGTHRATDVAIVPVTGSLLTRITRSDRIETYAGAGIMYLEVRRGHVDFATPDVHIGHLAQPDHVAILLQAKTRVRLGNRLFAVADARYGPAASTIEVMPAGSHNSLQANFHPLMVTSGLSLRF